MSSLARQRLPFEARIIAMEEQLAELETEHQRKVQALGPRSAAGVEAAAVLSSFSERIRICRRELIAIRRETFNGLDAWETVQVARHPSRPQSRDYLDRMFEQFVEIHGDRAIGDDPAIVTGFAHLEDRKILFVGHQKGKNLEERKACHFGCAHPEGYRKALRVMKLAEKFRLPIISFIDTPGAYPGISAEERGQAAIIAENLLAMSQLKTPILSVVIGEGGSGGALGIGVSNRIAMLQHTYYSVISPEGCASILWKDSDHAPQAAAALKMTSRDLKRFGVIDDIIDEPDGAAHANPADMAVRLKKYLLTTLRELSRFSDEEVLNDRYERFRRIGAFEEHPIELPGHPADGPATLNDEGPSLDTLHASTKLTSPSPSIEDASA